MTARARIVLLILSIAVPPPSLCAQDLEQRETFAKAYALFSAGKFSQAKEHFQRTLDPSYPLADYGLYYLAVISFNEGNWNLSRQLSSQLRQRYPQSVWFHHAQLQRAKIDFAEKKYPQAIDAFRSLRSVKSSNNDISEESLYLEAQAQENLGDVSRAYSLYQELRNLYPDSRWTPSARKEQARLRDTYPEVLGFNTIQSLSDEADRLIRERDYGEAEILYRKLLDNVTEPDFRLRLLGKLSGLYLSVRKRHEAIPILKQIASEYSETHEAPKALYQIGQILWNRNDNEQALDYFKQVMERHPISLYTDRAQYAAADIYESLGKKEEAVTLYSNVPAQFPASPVRDDAAWRLGWLYYRAGELSQAYAVFKTLAAQATNGALRTAALYWQSRVAEKTADMELARQLYQQVFNAGAESYYQSLAANALARLGVVLEEPKAGSVVPQAEADPPISSEVSFHLSRARELAGLSLNRLALTELDEINRIAARRPSLLRSLLVREYFRNQAYGRSLSLANELPASDGERNRYRFPLAYWDTIQRKAQEQELDPYLIVALIRQESLFDARARSTAFALGLMQLLPSTAARVAKKIGLPAPSNEKLFEPEVNLTLGTQYLKELLQRYSNNWFKAIAAYNAGESAVDRWEKEIVTDDIEEFVERIPYFETRAYVKLVLRNHRIYKRLYDQQR